MSTAAKGDASAPVAHALADALDHLHVGLIVLSAESSVLFTNDAAEQILSARDGLLLCNGTLQMESSAAAERLTAALVRISRMSARAQRQCADVITIERQRTNAPLQVCVTPLRDPVRTWVAGLFLSDPARVEPSCTLFARLYALTPAESRMAAALLRTGNATAAANSLGISLNTARSHIKELYRKTSTRGQGELVRLLASGLGSLQLTF